MIDEPETLLIIAIILIAVALLAAIWERYHKL